MSLLTCESCDAPVNTDNDPGAICEFDGTVHCEDCRERAYDRHQEWLMETGGGPTLQEQQIAAMRFK
jgi:hypothetical protein